MKKRFLNQAVIFALTIAAAGLIMGCMGVAGPRGRYDPSKQPKYPFPQGTASLATYAVQPKMPVYVSEIEMNEKMIGLLKRILEENLIFDTRPEDVAANPKLNPFSRENLRITLQHHTRYPVGAVATVLEQHLNVSESQGYGMVILAYMAGCEKELEAAGYKWRFNAQSLKDYYDGMLRTVLRFKTPANHPGSAFQYSWELFGHNTTHNETGLAINDLPDNRTRGYRYLENSNKSPKVAPFWNTARGQSAYAMNGNASATDGDMDIMYSLIVADKQWGSSGEFNYRRIALDMMAAFNGAHTASLVNPVTKHLKLGDWVNNNVTGGYGCGTRPSDFMMAHLKAYKAFDPDRDWQSVIDTTYEIIRVIREGQAAQGNPNNGLLPDFVVRNESAPVYKWEPAENGFLEGNDDQYGWNSCRTPWRLGTDYLLYGDTPIGTKSLKEYVLEPMNRLAEAAIGTSPSAYLNGLGMRKKLSDAGFSGDTNPTFAAPLLVTAVGISDNQRWIDTLWNYPHLANWQGNWYADYYKLLCMIVASGNYWKPEAM